MVFDKFSQEGFVKYKATKIKDESFSAQKPYSSNFWAAGFSFSMGTIVKDCPYQEDLDFIFFGEEHF